MRFLKTTIDYLIWKNSLLGSILKCNTRIKHKTGGTVVEPVKNSYHLENNSLVH